MGMVDTCTPVLTSISTFIPLTVNTVCILSVWLLDVLCTYNWLVSNSSPSSLLQSAEACRYVCVDLDGFLCFCDCCLVSSCCWLCQHTELRWPNFLHTWQRVFLCLQVAPVWPCCPRLGQAFCWLYNFSAPASTAGKLRISLSTASAALAYSIAMASVRPECKVANSFCVLWSFKPPTNWSRRAVSKHSPKLQVFLAFLPYLKTHFRVHFK